MSSALNTTSPTAAQRALQRAAQPQLQVSAPNDNQSVRDIRWSGFFKYHGIWSPGVRLFRSIGFRAKACIVALTFLLPLLVLGFNYFKGQATQIEFSAKERLGVAYQRELMPLLALLQRQRLLSVQAAAKGVSATADPAGAELQTAIQLQKAKLLAVEKRHGDALGTAKAYAQWEESTKALAAAGSGIDTVFAAHSAHVQALLDLLGTATDGSNLTLDPDIDTYYLMDAALFRLPLMIESVAQVRGLGSALLIAGSAAPAQSRRIVEQLTLLTNNQSAVEQGVDKAVAYNAEVKAQVKPEQNKAVVRAFIAQVDITVLRPEGLQGEPVAHVKAANAAIDALTQLGVEATNTLDDLIAVRVAGLEAQRNITAAVLALGMLAALYLFVCFGKVLDGGLKEVAFHIDAMRDGDLTTQLRPWGGDEAAKLMLSLQQMQGSLRHIVGQVRVASDSIVGASTEIASGAADLRTRTEISAASLEETATAMDQIASTVKRSESGIDEAALLATDNAKAAKAGGDIIHQVVQTMQAINASSGRIGDIIGTIEGIAFQTNILALNAAVEAARAGEQGRGFAVVAAEVRALAQRSSVASKEIKTLISGSVEHAEHGARVVQQAGVAMVEIVSTAQRVQGLLADVATSAREQSAGVAQSAQAVQQLDSATQQNAALVEETANAASALNGHAQTLAREVAQFKLTA
jgi:methyl-accepting chemotaxis protein